MVIQSNVEHLHLNGFCNRSLMLLNRCTRSSFTILQNLPFPWACTIGQWNSSSPWKTMAVEPPQGRNFFQICPSPIYSPTEYSSPHHIGAICSTEKKKKK